MTAFSRVRNILGEGPLWDAATQSLWWVDIHGKQILRQAWGSNRAEVYQLEQRPTALGQIDHERLMVAFEDGIFNWSPNRARELITQVAERPQNRSNDGKMGPDGRFWFGTMDDEERIDSGALYSIGVDQELTMHQDKIGISNTFAWSPDGRFFYFADSKAQLIYRYPFSTAGLGKPEIFVDLRGTEFYPDGSCMDAEGCLWNAQWDGHRVVRYAPSGQVMDMISLPVQRPTSCCFGGPEGQHLFITSASVGLSEADLAEQPLAGHVLCIKTNTEGMPNHYWGK